MDDLEQPKEDSPENGDDSQKSDADKAIEKERAMEESGEELPG